MDPAFTPAARELVRDAGLRARSMGHGWVGNEHLLLALAAHDGPVGEVMRGHGITVPQVEKIILGPTRRGRGEGLFDTIDREALAAIGIDLDLVRDTIERKFGPTTFRPMPAHPPRRFPPRFARRLARRPHRTGTLTRAARDFLAGAAKSAKSDHLLVDVDHLALRMAMSTKGTAYRILATIGVSRDQLVRDLMATHGKTK